MNPNFWRKKPSLFLSHFVPEIDPPTINVGKVHSPLTPSMSIIGNIPDEHKTKTNFAKQLSGKYYQSHMCEDVKVIFNEYLLDRV